MARSREVALVAGPRVHRRGAGAPARRVGGRAARQAVMARTVDLAMHCVPAPRRILDVGCGTGDLLSQLAAVAPTAVALVGVDAAPDAIASARASGHDDRLRFDVGAADSLRYADGTFDLVVSTASLDRWREPHAILAQCARVLAPGGMLVLTGRFSALKAPAALARRGAACTRHRAQLLLVRHGFHSVQWHAVHGGVRAVSATGSGDWPVVHRTA